MTTRFLIQQTQQTIDIPAGQTVLEAALAAGVDYPHGCKSGTCGACKSLLLAGTVTLAPHSIYALTDEDRAKGLVLACRSHPRGDGEIAWLISAETVTHPLQRLDCRVVETGFLTPKIRRVRLKPENGGRFVFSAGQFASVTFEGRPARDYSMANRPANRILEFHIRRVDGGSSSVHAADTLAVGDPVAVTGPFGSCWLRENHKGPIIAVAGGSGLAPVKAIVETALARRMRQPIRLYIEAETETDLYLVKHFEGLADRFDGFEVTPLLTEPSEPSTFRVGFAHDAILEDWPDLDGAKIYAAGTPEMVDAVTRTAVDHGVRNGDIHGEPFHIDTTG